MLSLYLYLLIIGRGGGRLFLNVSKLLEIDGMISADGISGSRDCGGGSGGSLWIYVHIIKGNGKIKAIGGDGSKFGGGGSGGRIAVYFKVNETFTRFKYSAYGGSGGSNSEAGGAGTVFLYHLIQEHRTLLIDNNGQSALNKHMTYSLLSQEGGKAWIMPASGIHHFADKDSLFHFEELQVFGSAHVAFWPRNKEPEKNTSLFFRYMIGDRTGMVHVGPGQDLDLKRDEIDLPFSVDVYKDGHLGLAPVTFIHGIEIILRGTLSHVLNITLHHGAELWLLHGGRTMNTSIHHFRFDFVRVQDTSIVHAVTSPVKDPGITFYTRSMIIEGGGVMRGSRLTFLTTNLTIDDGGKLIADGLGYNATHGFNNIGLHGTVNPGHGISSVYGGSGAGHGGRGGRGQRYHGAKITGGAYGDLYEPEMFGSVGGRKNNQYRGGNGGGVIWLNVTHTIDIDGLVSANGEDAPNTGSGGGSGGSIWMHCKRILGYGKISVNGGKGSQDAGAPGGGGSGGRIAIYFQRNETSTYFVYEARGGAARGCELGKENRCEAEAGGPGTVFLYHTFEEHRTLLINNGGQKPLVSAIENYEDLRTDGCKAWILPQSGKHHFAKRGQDFHFEELQIYGGGHLAILTEPVGNSTSLFFKHMIGDRSGVVHIGLNQVMDLRRDEIDLPFSVHVYSGGFLGLAPYTEVHGVTLYLSGELAHVENMTLHHGGAFWMYHGGRTINQSNSTYRFDTVRIQDNGVIQGLTSAVNHPGVKVQVRSLYVEGGGRFYASRPTIDAENITIDDGGCILADTLGYNRTHVMSVSLHGEVNPGKGYRYSGAGHGGTGGRGQGAEWAGLPYDDLYEAAMFGSSGGGKSSGNGGGVIFFNVTNVFHIDGIVNAKGGDVMTGTDGGGSGGSISVHCYRIQGTGNISVIGGRGGPAGGGGGAGGRVSVYFTKNATFTGRTFVRGGASEIEAGGSGTAFFYHLVHTHRTLFVDNGGQHPISQVVYDYDDLSKQSCKTWILSSSGEHLFADQSHRFHFEELQIYGSAHLAITSSNITNHVTSLHFRFIIGDRSGTVHVGDHQSLDLRRKFIDFPSSARIYDGGFIGLATITEINKVTLYFAGTLAHVQNLTLLNGGTLHHYLTGSTEGEPKQFLKFTETVRVMADSQIIMHSSNADANNYTLESRILLIEGGALIQSNNLHIKAVNFSVDDGGIVSVNNGGHLAMHGPGTVVTNNWRASGAGHGGTGGRPSCSCYKTCQIRRGLAYGNMFMPSEFGSGGDGNGGGTGGGKLKIDIVHTLKVDKCDIVL